MSINKCFECGDLGFVLNDGVDSACWRLRWNAPHNAPGRAAVMLREAVEYLRIRKLLVDKQHFEIAKLLTRHTSKDPFNKAELLETHYTMPLRSFMGVIEDLRKVWLLPIASSKSKPYGYWFITDADEFSEWVRVAGAAPRTQLITIARVARRNFPKFAQQFELDFKNEIGSWGELAAVSDIPVA